MGGHMQQPGGRSAHFAVHVAFMGSAPLPHSYHLVAKSRLQHIDVNSSHCLADIKSAAMLDRPHFLSTPRRHRDCPLKLRFRLKGDSTQVDFQYPATQANAPTSRVGPWPPGTLAYVKQDKTAWVKRIHQAQCSWMAIPQMPANARAKYMLDASHKWAHKYERLPW